MKPIMGRGSSAQATRFTGVAVPLTNITPTAATAGTVVYTVQLNPTTLGINMFNKVCSNYQRWWMVNIEFQLTTGMAENEQGAIMGFFNSEPNDDINLIDIGLRIDNGAKRPGSKTFPVWDNNMIWSLPVIMQKPVTQDGKVLNELFYTDIQSGDIERRFTSLGSFNIIVANKLGAVASATGGLGNLQVRATVDMYFMQEDLSIPTPINSGVLKYDGAGANMQPAFPLGDAPSRVTNSTQLAFNYANSTGRDTFTGFPTYDTNWLYCFSCTGTVITANMVWVGTGCTVTDSANQSLILASGLQAMKFGHLRVSATTYGCSVYLSIAATTITISQLTLIPFTYIFAPKPRLTLKGLEDRIKDLERETSEQRELEAVEINDVKVERIRERSRSRGPRYDLHHA
jgi:hypothetical protein